MITCPIQSPFSFALYTEGKGAFLPSLMQKTGLDTHTYTERHAHYTLFLFTKAIKSCTEHLENTNMFIEQISNGKCYIKQILRKQVINFHNYTLIDIDYINQFLTSKECQITFLISQSLGYHRIRFICESGKIPLPSSKNSIHSFSTNPFSFS